MGKEALASTYPFQQLKLFKDIQMEQLENRETHTSWCYRWVLIKG